MDEVSEAIYSFFTNATDFTDEMSTRIYPLVAQEGTTAPFAIYVIGAPEPFTKEASVYPISLNMYYEPHNYTECTTFNTVVESLVESKANWNHVDSTINYIEEDTSIVATINFEIIH